MHMLMLILIVVPFFAALGCYLFRVAWIRTGIVLGTSMLLMVASLALIAWTPHRFSPETLFGLGFHELVQALDFLLLVIILYFGIKHQSLIISILAVFQIVLLGYLEFFMIREPAAHALFYADTLSVVMVLIICLVGSVICIQALPYMKNHEKHLDLGVSRQPRFFFIMLLFLGAMNGVVLANDLIIFYFFFELTTLCSFLLIGHDRNRESTKNAVRALWMNSLAGAAFITALVMVYADMATMDMQSVIHSGVSTRWVVLGMAFMCFAAFAKSAQFPFQSWLLGAMVAPTPVSALLHSSTMVKVGVYLVLRIAPAMSGLFLTHCVAVFGAFTFLAAAALAVGQSNGKKVLAYSTISNLGLIFACAGINSPAAITAAVFLIIFHAVSKALLFLCVGTIEQHIESRNIEDMRGLYARMPVTALITVLGVISMIMPPFGLLLGKWMAIEAAAGFLVSIFMIALGSALTVMYWARWAGILMSDPFAGRFRPEKQARLTWFALGSLGLAICVLSVLSPVIYSQGIVPMISGQYYPSYESAYGILKNAYGSFAVLPLSVVAAVCFLIAIRAVRGASRARVTMPYLSGLQTNAPRVFRGPMNRPVTAEAGSYYLDSIFGEHRLTVWMNLAACVLLTLVIGGAL